MAHQVAVHSADELTAWVRDDGALDDTILVSVDLAARRLTFGLRVLEESTGDPRDAFRRTSERFLSFTLSALDAAAISVDGELRLPAPMTCVQSAEGEAFGLEVTAGTACIRATAAAWLIAYGPEIDLPVVRTMDPVRITFHGPGPLVAGALRSGIVARGTHVELCGNWAGSGQSFGAAFVRDVHAPAALDDGEFLSGAWRIVPAGATAADARGVWVTGKSLPSAAYASVERTAQSDRALACAVVEALASLPGLAWASSGSLLVESEDARRAWCSAL